MNHVLKHIKWHPKVKIIFLVKLALIDVTSAFESWASTLQLAVSPTILQPGFCWSSYPKGWVADHSDTSPLCFHLKSSWLIPLYQESSKAKELPLAPVRELIFSSTFSLSSEEEIQAKKPSPLTAQIKNGIREEKRKWGTESPKEMGTILKVCFYAFLHALLRMQWVKGRLPSPSEK